MAETPTVCTALLPPGTTLGLFCGSAALLFVALPWASLAFAVLGFLCLWRARRAVVRQPTVYRESGLRIVTRLLLFTALALALLVLLGSGDVPLPVDGTVLW